MARRKRTNTLEDLMDLVARLPWWAGVSLALISYLLLHSVATQPADAPAQPTRLAEMFALTVWKAVASVGQYVLPIACLAGAGMSAWRRKVRSALVQDVVQREGGDVIDGMSWREFELLVGEGFRLQGYQVVESGGGGADGGVDLVLTRPGKRGGETFLVQCKQWRAYKVGVSVVRELYGVMAARGATGGFVITSGCFTDDAIEFASGRNVSLVDGSKLVELIRRAKAGGRQAAAQTDPAKVHTSNVAATEGTACPVCSEPMVRRTAKRGTNAGRAFWGCTAYPACRGTRAID